MQARYILSLLLLVVGSALAQPEPQNVQPPADTNAARQTEIRRRFRARATNNLAAPGIPAPGTPGMGIPAPGSITPGATNSTFPAFPTPGANPAVTPSAQSAPGTPEGNAPVVFPAPANPIPNTPVVTSEGRVTNPMPLPGAATPATQVAPSTGTPLPSLPAPGSTPSTATAVSGVILPPNTTPEAGAGLPVSSSAINPALSAEEAIPKGTIQLQVMPLDQFLELYAAYAGRTILRPTALPAPAGFTLRAETDLTRREVIEAMDGVLSLNGITMIPIGDKFVKAVPSTQADKEGTEISHASAAELPNSEQFITRIVKLKTAKPTEIATVIQGFAKSATAVTPIDSNQTLILRDYASNIKRMLEIIDKIDVMPESDFTLEVIPIKYGKVTDIYATMAALTGGGAGGGATGGGFTGGGTGAFGGAGASGFRGGTGGMRGNTGVGGMNRGGGGFGSGSQYNRGGSSGYGGSGYGSGGNYYPMESLDDQQIFPQQVATPAVGAGAAQQNFNRRLNDIVSRASQTEVQVLESAKIVPDERSNRLLIFANKRDMIMITNLVSKVDVLLAQVLIEAIIMEVKLGDSLAFGVNAVQNTKKFGKDFTGAGAMNNNPALLGSLTNFPGSAPEGFSYFGRIGDDFDVAISALAKDNAINILSRPRIQTSHAIPGFFFIGETVPYITGFTDYGGLGAGLSTRSQIQERTIGLQLDVVPFITPEGMVVMEIQQNFDQRGGEVTIDGNPVPLVNSRQASAMLTVRDGDVIMLGGFISDSRSKSHSGVPFLKDIPGLGALFRQKNNQNDRTELIILMKATVLESPEAAAILADRERMALPGVRQAEREFQDAETKRMKKVDKKLRR